MRLPPKLTKFQIDELAKLEPALRSCLRTANCKRAEKLMTQIQLLLKPTGHTSRLLQAKNWFFECSMEGGQLEFAISGFEGVRKLMSDNTRTHLEATALLGICYLRKGNVDLAKKYLRETVRKINNIQSDKRRRQFHKRLLTRIEEECVLSGLVDFGGGKLDLDEVHDCAIELVKTKSEEEIAEILGTLLPPKSIFLLTSVREFTVNEIIIGDRKFLPAPPDTKKPRELGLKAQAALKRVAWKSVCDPETELFKAWPGGLGVAYNKTYITAAIMASLSTWKITATMLAASVVALVMKFGATTFCETFVPGSVMIERSDGEE